MEQSKAGFTKEKILSTMRFRGPSLPVRISKEIDMSPLFASAFLSELFAEGKIKISHMRVGSSPLYYLPGQESQLENFTQHLNQREKEALHILKEKRVLEDSDITPVIRVALRDIKDFAHPFRMKVNNEEKSFWKYFAVSETEAINQILSKNTPPLREKAKPEKEIPLETEPLKAIEREKQIETNPEEETILQVKSEHFQKKQKETDFGNNVREHLSKKSIEILESIAEKKKEFEGKVRTNTLFGKQNYYMIAKDKKSVTDNDLAMALQKSQLMKMPALVISPGDLNKKAKEYLSHWENLIKFDKIE